ncbi:MAG: tetratricopeptide repeat protein [Spartobacteria bacterium]
MQPPQQPVLQGPVLEDSALEWDLFWEKNKSLILAIVAVVVIGGVGVAAWFAYSSSQNAAAQTLLAEAKGIPALQAVVDKFPKSMPAAGALLQIAAAERESGNTEKSTAAFREFLNRFPKHPLAVGALLGVAMNEDAAGDIQSAMTTCQQVVTQFPQSYAAPFAAYTEAEILLRGLRIEEARRGFNMVMTQYPASPAARMSAGQLSRLGGGTPAAPQQ